MQPLDLNLASNPFRNNTLLWVGYSTATVLLVAFSFWNATTFTDHRARLRELRATAGTFESQRLDLETRGKRALDGIRRFDIDALEIQAAKANEVIEWKAFSWTRLFNALEEVQPNQVRMSGVRPIFSVTQSQAEREQVEEAGIPVSIEGIAHDLGAFTALERAMQEHGSFGRVEPDRLARTEGGEISFQMHAWYRFGDAAEVDDAGLAAEAASTEPLASDEAPVAAEGVDHAETVPAEVVGNPGAMPQADVEEPWTAGQAPGTGEVESAGPAVEPPRNDSAPAAAGKGRAGR